MATTPPRAGAPNDPVQQPPIGGTPAAGPARDLGADGATETEHPEQPGSTRRRTEDRLVDEIVAGSATSQQRRIYRSMVSTVARLADHETEVIDLKIADSALAEMADAFRVFQPFRKRRKVTIFGSARTQPDHPAYRCTRELAASMADSDWMVVTGAGPGIMAAGMEGAGRDLSIGVNIRLPFEQAANNFIAQDPKLVEMLYFFTRKLMLIKESDGYVVMPGGFGTLDEGFELLTLLQTGKAEPAPVVMLDVPGGDYWRGWLEFLGRHVEPHGLVSDDDRALFLVTDDVTTATSELLGFYRNYQSCRWVGELLVIRLRQGPDDAQLADLNRRFADIVADGIIRRSKPLPPERSDTEQLGFDRLILRFDRIHYGRLRQLIDATNQLVD